MRSRTVIALSLLITFTAFQAAAAPQGASGEPAPFVVHEWGTFTSVQGRSGKQIWWLPHIKTDLPSFVYSRQAQNGGFRDVKLLGGKESQTGIVRMETPVIYFYSDTAQTVDVRVLMPQGEITEWYPQATRVGPCFVDGVNQTAEMAKSLIEWKGVKILPRETAEVSAAGLIRTREDPKADHYYAARATNANLLRVTSPHATGVEYERDLFYRGLGFFPGPLTATVGAYETELTLATMIPSTLQDLFVVSVHQGLMRYQHVERVTPSASINVALDAVPFADLNDVRATLMEDVVEALKAQGLYAQEAQAMVDTWKDQWFAEEGTRVLYLLPRTWTDSVLPLEITPKPADSVRVMVGRAEVVMPSVERGLGEQLTAFRNGDTAAKKHAAKAVRDMNLGRFLAPAVTLAAGDTEDQQVWLAVYQLTEQAGATALLQDSRGFQKVAAGAPRQH